jgi:hypothetical protein
MALILRISSCEAVVRLCTIRVIPESVGVADGVNPEDVLLRGCGEAVYLKVLVLQMALILRVSSCEAVVRLCT